MFSFSHAEGMCGWVSNPNLMLGYSPSIPEVRQTHEPLLRYRLRTQAFVYRYARRNCLRSRSF